MRRACSSRAGNMSTRLVVAHTWASDWMLCTQRYIYIYNWSVLCCAVQGGKVSKFTGWEAVRIANTHEGAGMQGRI